MSANILKIAALQIASLPLEKAKLDYYAAVARSKGVKLLVLPEYSLNLFFKELTSAPLEFIAEQSKKQAENIARIAEIYSLQIIAPLVMFKKKLPYKCIALFSQKGIRIYEQQVLMSYLHWNEEVFFANETKVPQLFTFTLDGFKLAVMAGFELHFDSFFSSVLSKKVDAMILPSAATFSSQNRWREVAKTRAFLSNSYLLRVNRIGEWEDTSSHRWHFYGDSFLVDPFGDIENYLGDREEMLICDIDKVVLKEARRVWRFHALNRGLRNEL